MAKIAEEAGKRRDMYKVIILALFESCARVSELLHLKKGDAEFSTVTDKGGYQKLIAVLHFKRKKERQFSSPNTLESFLRIRQVASRLDHQEA